MGCDVEAMTALVERSRGARRLGRSWRWSKDRRPVSTKSERGNGLRGAGLTCWGAEPGGHPAAWPDGVALPRDGPHACRKAFVQDGLTAALCVPGFVLKLKPTSHDT